MLKSTAVPLMKKFGIDGDGLELKVMRSEGEVAETPMLLVNNCCLPAGSAFPTGGKKGHGAWWRWRGGLHMSSPPDHQASTADRAGKNQED